MTTPHAAPEEEENECGPIRLLNEVSTLVRRSKKAYQEALEANDDSFAAPVGEELEALSRLSIEMGPPMSTAEIQDTLAWLRDGHGGLEYVSRGQKSGHKARQQVLGKVPDFDIEVVEVWMDGYTASMYNAVHLQGGKGVLRDRAVATMAFDPKAAGFFDLVFGAFKERVFELREKGLGAFEVYQAMVSGDATAIPYSQRKDKLSILVGGSPKLFFLLHEIYMYTGERLVVFVKEAVHVWLLQTMMKLMGIEHATLSSGDATAFNDLQSKLKVLICTEVSIELRAHHMVVLDVLPIEVFLKAATCLRSSQRPVVKLVVVDGTDDITRLSKVLAAFEKDHDVDVQDLMGCRKYVTSQEPWDAVTREHEMLYRIGKGGEIAASALATWAAKVKGERLQKLQLPRGHYTLRPMVDRYEGKAEVTKVVLACAERIRQSTGQAVVDVIEGVLEQADETEALTEAMVYHEDHPEEVFEYPEECVVE